jgi:hypothetical protein
MRMGTDEEGPEDSGSDRSSLKDRFKKAVRERVEQNRQRFQEELERPMGEHFMIVASHVGRAGNRLGGASRFAMSRLWHMKQRLDEEADPDEDTGLAGQDVAVQAFQDTKDLFDEEDSSGTSSPETDEENGPEDTDAEQEGTDDSHEDGSSDKSGPETDEENGPDDNASVEEQDGSEDENTG